MDITQKGLDGIVSGRVQHYEVRKAKCHIKIQPTVTSKFGQLPHQNPSNCYINFEKKPMLGIKFIPL